MSESYRGLLYLNEKYGVKLDNRTVINKGQSLFDTIINTQLTEDKKNLLTKKHALNSERGLTPGNERAMKDIKSFNSHMPDILRRLDWYVEEEAKGATVPELEAEQNLDYVRGERENEIYQGIESEQLTEEEEKDLRKKYYKEAKEQDEQRAVYINKLQPANQAGKLKAVFTSSSSQPVESKQQEEEQVDPFTFSETPQTSIVYDEPTQEQENSYKDFIKNLTDNPSKRFALIILDKEGNVIHNYKSINEFKDDSDNYNKYHFAGYNSNISKRKAGDSIIDNTTGDALYFIPLNAYRDHYQTQTWLRRHKKKIKKTEKTNNESVEKEK